MSQRYSNNTGIPLSVAVWLATDNYDHNPDPNTISVTTLMKSVRQITLSARAEASGGVTDVSELVSSAMGTAFHDAIERAWTVDPQKALKALGYPDKVIARIKVNPTNEDLANGCIPIYMEQRNSKVVNGITISGKFDFIGDGRLEDFKSTGTYSYTSKCNESKYILQGSLYRWLNPQLITNDVMAIDYIFTDWSGLSATTSKGYPPSKIFQEPFTMYSEDEMQAYVENKVEQILFYRDTPDELLPLCNDEELWRKEPVFKYYSKPGLSKSTANFTTSQEAQDRLAEKGVGYVLEVKGKVVACLYCSAKNICSQRNALIASGDLSPKG